MSQSADFNGETHTIPEQNERGWGPAVTALLIALAENALTSTLSLLAEMDLGSTYGIRAKWFRSRTASPAEAGAVRLARADTVSWRNEANDDDHTLGPDEFDELHWNDTAVALQDAVSPAVLTLGFVSSGNDTTKRYSCPGGPAAAAGTTELQITAPYSLKVARLYVKCASAPTGTCTFVVRKNGSDQALTCTVTSGNTTGSDITEGHAFYVAQGDLLSVSHQMTSGNAPGATTVSLGLVQD